MLSFFKAWMLSFLSVEENIILSVQYVIIFHGAPYMLSFLKHWVLSFYKSQQMLSFFNVIIWCFHLVLSFILCYHLMLSFDVIIYCYHFPPFFFFLKTWHTPIYQEKHETILHCFMTLSEQRDFTWIFWLLLAKNGPKWTKRKNPLRKIDYDYSRWLYGVASTQLSHFIQLKWRVFWNLSVSHGTRQVRLHIVVIRHRCNKVKAPNSVKNPLKVTWTIKIILESIKRRKTVFAYFVMVSL